jgi:hypothetical protein
VTVHDDSLDPPLHLGSGKRSTLERSRGRSRSPAGLSTESCFCMMRSSNPKVILLQAATWLCTAQTQPCCTQHLHGAHKQ